ncbi:MULTISPECIES: hypothetical protein [unclassified Acinetobacter]|uniref:hypothetical protein n=1 Tax=unclassified Acinetobacter TaxID=196816 RepID=UPI002934C7FC|nr:MULTISPECIES: hypothetical protein [unclassified Acinetobacter]WOE31994.1 hypothetical protein QSG84_01845 [Acinetobacter sp. SAAs470]WOE37462.1 hypothetical protein QSG86_10890 [Acinetobacter sp. SAAs474]
MSLRQERTTEEQDKIDKLKEQLSKANRELEELKTDPTVTQHLLDKAHKKVEDINRDLEILVARDNYS